MIEPALKRAIAAAVHQAVAEFDEDHTGVWRCKTYAVTGADLLRTLTNAHHEPVAGFTGVHVDAPPTLPLVHASGLPLSAKPSWSDSVKHVDERTRPGHAWIQNCTNIIDLSVKPPLWGEPDSLGEHWYEPDADYTRVLKLYHTPESVADITQRAIELCGSVWLAHQSINDAARMLERVASRWPTLADELVGFVRRNP